MISFCKRDWSFRYFFIYFSNMKTKLCFKYITYLINFHIKNHIFKTFNHLASLEIPKVSGSVRTI